MSEKKRMAGDALYSGEKDYGNWGEKWNAEAAQQQLKASGKYNADSDLAKQFEGLNKDGKSRVDNEDGWRELVFDDEAKGAGNYKDLVSKWSAAGFDVRAIDMNGDFANSNIAVRRSSGEGTGKDPFEGVDIPPVEDKSPSPEQSINPGGPKPEQGIPYPGFGSGYQSQNVNQDNDINSTVTGNNNNVTNTQDNRVTQVGGRGRPQYAFGLKDAYVNRILNR